MEDADFTDEFCRFIQSGVPSVEAAELLILFVRNPSAELRAEQAIAQLPRGVTLTPAQAGVLLEGFQARGLLSGTSQVYRFAPATEVLRAQAEMLQQAYNERPVTLIRIIYALRDSRIQSFADAFRLRKR